MVSFRTLSTPLLGLLVFTSLLILALVYYLERIGHIDMAFQTFLILKSGSLEIQSGRFGAAATQCWPWAAQALHLPLGAVLKAYSIGHVAWPALLFVWCLWLGQRQWAMVLLLVVTGMATHTFYWLSEMPQGLFFLVAVLAWMSAKGNLKAIRWYQWPIWAAAVVTAYYFHPMVMYAAVFACGWMILRTDQNRKANWKMQRWPVFAAMILMLGAISFVKYKWMKLDWYDAAALKRTKAFAELWPNWIDLQSNRDLWQYCLSDYWFVPVGLLVSVAYYLWKKQIWIAAFTALYPVAYVFLVNVPYHESTHQFYMENLWLPLGLFAATPLVFDALPGLFSDKIALWVVGLISIIGVARIARAHEPWTARLRWEQQFLAKTSQLPEKKLLLTESQVPMDTFKLAWGMAYEFLMLSSLESPEQARSILVTNEPQRYDTLLAKPRMFLGPFKNYEYSAMPARYFQFRDNSAYVRWNE